MPELLTASPKAKGSRMRISRSERSEFASTDDKRWSLYGAPWLQPVASNGKFPGRSNRKSKRNPLPPAAIGCLANGKEGVDGSSPSEGFRILPA